VPVEDWGAPLRCKAFFPFQERTQEESVMKCANPDFDRYGDPGVMSLSEARVPEPLRGSVLDPRISYPPVIVKSDGPKQLFIRFIANSHQRLTALVVRINESLCAPGML
jgi:hypothetical protein